MRKTLAFISKHFLRVRHAVEFHSTPSVSADPQLPNSLRGRRRCHCRCQCRCQLHCRCRCRLRCPASPRNASSGRFPSIIRKLCRATVSLTVTAFSYPPRLSPLSYPTSLCPSLPTSFLPYLTLSCPTYLFPSLPHSVLL